MNNFRKSAGLLFPAMRIAMALALLTTCMLLSADMFGFVPDEDKLILESRKKSAESLAIQFSVMDPARDLRKIESLIRLVAKRDEAIVSTGIRRSTGQLVFQSERTAKMGAYALCGFANFASIGIQIGGIGALAPERRSDLSRLALRAMLGGAFASWMTATVAGAFL